MAVQDLFYKQDIGPVGGLLLLLTTQMIGFGLSGLVYDLLVRPTESVASSHAIQRSLMVVRSMLWPSTLALVTLFNTLHGDSQSLTRQRLRFFYIAFLACFAWQFMPALFAPGLTSIAVLCIVDNVSSADEIPRFRAENPFT